MKFKRYEPSAATSRAIECYWTVEDPSTKPSQQKVIPDGFPEIIFHFGDPYRIKLSDHWERQKMSLFAGQIRKFFFLENTGRSRVFGVKLKPTTMTHLFGISMHTFTDSVMALDRVAGPIAIGPMAIGQVTAAVEKDIRDEERIDRLNDFFAGSASRLPTDHPADKAIGLIFERNGMITVAEISDELSVSERYLEQVFRKYVGLSPKFYARTIRFNYLFELIKHKDRDWSDVVYRAGFYDQSHFIRNFKAFTGEDPSRYLFEEENMANFFLKRKK